MAGVVTANLRFSTTPAQMKRELAKLIGNKAGVIGLQEVSLARAKVLKGFLAKQGYGIVMVRDVPVVFDKSRFKLASSRGVKLTSGNLRHVHAAVVALTDRKTGVTNVFTNTHLIRQSMAPRLHARQVHELAQLQRQIQQKYGKNANYFLTGDLNTGNAGSLRALEKAGLNLYRAPRNTGPKGGRPDWLASSLDIGGRRTIGHVPSDHDAYLGKFNIWRKAQADNNKSSGGGGNGGKDNNVSNNNNGGNRNGGMTNRQKSAFQIMRDLLKQYDLQSLVPDLRNIIQGGITDQNEITLALQQTDAWKQRFAGNEILRQKGLPVLSVAEYLGVEQSYAQIMKNYGLPQGFYDDHADFAKFIGNSVSANELQQRVQMYADMANREDPAIVAQLQSMGTTKGDLLAYMMNPSRAMPLIQQKYNTALLGGAARRAGIVADNGYLSHLTELGVTEQQAAQGYGEVAADLPGAEMLGSIYGDNITQNELAQSVFENNSAATSKVKRLASQERAAFNGASGSGALGRSSSGQY